MNVILRNLLMADDRNLINSSKMLEEDTCFVSGVLGWLPLIVVEDAQRLRGNDYFGPASSKQGFDT